MIKIWLASDHAGTDLKKKITLHLNALAVQKNYEVHDLGPETEGSVDYPDYADLVCRKLLPWTLIDTQRPENTHPTEIGILICGSGQGMAMRANKYPHIRAALGWDLKSTILSREHNDANILCLGSRFLEQNLALQMVDAFLATSFAGGRHLTRVVKVSSPIGK